jgi:hypothetical protein
MSKTPIEMLLDGVEWKAAEPRTAATLDDDIPHATHEGVMDLFGHKLRCYRLSNGKAVFHADDLTEFLTGWR